MVRCLLVFFVFIITLQGYSLPCIEKSLTVKKANSFCEKETVYIPTETEMGTFLFSGSSGTVFTIKNRKSEIFAVKKLDLKDTVKVRRTFPLWSSLSGSVLELIILTHFKSDSLVNGYVYLPDHENAPKSEYYVIMPLYTSDLFEFQPQYGYLEKKERLKVMQAVLRGLFLLHNKGILHGDVKAENVLVQVKNGVTEYALTDFGMSCTFEQDSCFENHCFYTLNYRPPEVIFEGEPQLASDVWAFGCMVVEILTRDSAMGGTLEQRQMGSLAVLKDIISQTCVSDMAPVCKNMIAKLYNILENPSQHHCDQQLGKYCKDFCFYDVLYLNLIDEPVKKKLKNTLEKALGYSSEQGQHLHHIFNSLRKCRLYPKDLGELKEYWKYSIENAGVMECIFEDVEVIGSSLRCNPDMRAKNLDLLRKVVGFLGDLTDIEQLKASAYSVDLDARLDDYKSFIKDLKSLENMERDTGRLDYDRNFLWEFCLDKMIRPLADSCQRNIQVHVCQGSSTL